MSDRTEIRLSPLGERLYQASAAACRRAQAEAETAFLKDVDLVIREHGQTPPQTGEIKQEKRADGLYLSWPSPAKPNTENKEKTP